MCNKPCCKACCKVLVGAIILIALVLAITVSFVHQQAAMGYVIFASRFFDVMIPVLGVGALLKYLLCHRGCCCKGICDEKKQEGSSCCKSDR